MLNVLLITLGLAYVTELAGLSLALGAFVAGALISETEYRYQVEVDIKPFRDVLLGLFFVTIGMLLDLRVVFEQAHWVLLLLGPLLVLKALLIFGLSLAFGADSAVALRTGLALAACGEFGFVLLARADGLGLMQRAGRAAGARRDAALDAGGALHRRAQRAASRAAGARSDWMHRAMELHNIAVQSMATDQHVVICGYGRSGQNLARLLEQESIPFIALDLDPQRIREAAAAGESVVFGDAARREVLVAAGLLRAKALAITYSDTASALRILGHVQETAARAAGGGAHARRHRHRPAEGRRRGGSRRRDHGGQPHARLDRADAAGRAVEPRARRIRETREQRYSLFRGFFRGITDETDGEDEAQQPRLHSVTIAPGAAAIGRTLGDDRSRELSASR